MRKLKVSFILVAMLVLSAVTLCYGETKSDVKVVYNTHTLDFGDKDVVNQDGSIYIPIRAFSEKLHYTVDWDSAERIVYIYDNLSNVILSTSGKVYANNTWSESEKVPLMINGSIYVPLRFVSENLGVDVNYDNSKRVVNMTGRDIYEVSQVDINKPNLIAYTPEGKKQVCVIGDKSGTINENDIATYNLTSVVSVHRTDYSDIVTTEYVYSGAMTVNVINQIYVKDGVMIENANKGTQGYDLITGLPSSTKYMDNRVALLKENENGDTIIDVFDDKTGTLIKSINTKETFSEELNKIYQNENNGLVDNIQAVGEDFIVINMLQPLSYATDDEQYLGQYYYTTIVNLDTMEVIPVYEHFDAFINGDKVIDGEMRRAGANYSIADDDVQFLRVTEDGKLYFICSYDTGGEFRKVDFIDIEYK